MPKNILMISDGRIHPPWMGRFWLRYALAGLQGFNFARVRHMDDLPGLDLSGFHGMVLYFHHKTISTEALEAFERFVSAGGGVLAIHSATASFLEDDRFTDILGGKFSGHGPVTEFELTPLSRDDEIFGGISPFCVTDELYLHDLQPAIEPRFTALHEGQPVPVVWTRTHGKGRVCYACPGHRAASLHLPAFQQVLLRGLAWACGG
jgi:type 1 glutamine amidotransferase